MSLDSSLPVLLAQMAHVEKIAHDEMVHPVAQQAAAKQNAAEELKREQQSVEKTPQSKDAQAVVDKDGRQGSGGKPRKRRAKPPPDIDEEDEQPERSAKSPWQGNILNVKV
ncbi:hypothetical protein LN040_09220 [Desulfovibrio subterraneus]|jgi:hypothetical protein|uniref:Uncharacterized protein n=1 Tax=Desulfovibrio subterraneus TaxID=2718620 RepID=A0A7J0BNL0_9BACT|nr:hypothetical protein [Desulfovibrio subterraneus]WBF69244.1 hypothetical protein LN040_09220 [Desulfovibrio subterraneus]GFM35260.1 hypothetical protein DSM101010T_36250 [Desulfovibrio subterraneus]